MAKRKLRPEPYIPRKAGADKKTIKRRKSALRREYEKRLKAARERIREQATPRDKLDAAGKIGSSLTGLILQYTWRDIGQATGISPQVVSDYFAGRRIPNFERGVALARFLDVRPERLCDYLVRIRERTRLAQKAKDVARYHWSRLTPEERAEITMRRSSV